MWQLKKLSGEAVIYLISSKHSYVVGRKNSDITIEEDSSISRKHSTIYVAEKSECDFPVNTITGIWIVDENSKYGTFIRNSQNEWDKINKEEPKPLSHGTIIRFGLMDSIWSLQYRPIIACTSGMQSDDKIEIAKLLKAIDGELKNSWSYECNLTVVKEITLTVKVVLAMINGIPIVTFEYLQNLVNSVRNQQPFPDYKNFRPAISESVLDESLVSLVPTKTRKHLFKEKIFIFPTRKQFETLREVIVSAGGQANLLDSSSKNWQKLADEKVIVVQLPSDKSKIPKELITLFEELTNYLQKNHGRRVIDESEIALAIAYSSTEKYCCVMNESFKKTVWEEETQDWGVVLVEETPELTDKVILDPCVIPCTATDDSQMNAIDAIMDEFERQKGQKRCLSPNPDEPKSKISRSGFDTTAKTSTSAEERNFSDTTETGKTSVTNPTFEKPNNTKIADNNVIKIVETRESDLKDKMSETQKKSRHTEALKKYEEIWNAMNAVSANKRKLQNEQIQQDSTLKRRKLPTNDDVGGRKQKSEEKASKSGTKEYNTIPSKEHQWKEPMPESEQGDSLDDFMEIDKTNVTISQWDNSIYSVSLISSLYLKDDGSLIDPPEKLVNVKKFKKKKVRVETLPISEEEDDLSEGWLEVHPLNTSSGSIDGKYAW